jgi:hypothetical protein
MAGRYEFMQRMQVYYPSTFEGTWNVTGVLKEVTFPQGQRFLRVDVPGVTKASMIAALPDVGAGMETPVTYQCRYARGADGVTPDRWVSHSPPDPCPPLQSACMHTPTCDAGLPRGSIAPASNGAQTLWGSEIPTDKTTAH